MSGTVRTPPPAVYETFGPITVTTTRTWEKTAPGVWTPVNGNTAASVCIGDWCAGGEPYDADELRELAAQALAAATYIDSCTKGTR
jgi:hypothetical protein